MKNIITLLLFFSSLFAQKVNVEGFIKSSEDSSPLFLANILIENTIHGTTTDEKGYFKLSADVGGKSNLIISYLGFEQKTITIQDFLTTDSKTIYLDKKIFTSQTVLVRGAISKSGSSPVSFSQIKKDEIKENYVHQDIPEFLSYLPSTTFYSESGNGVGYNYMSIRGFDQRRISISINGIPQNDPEDHNIYWIDLPDLLENTELIQVQRGAGNGVIGYPAVGGSINIITATHSDKSKYELYSTLGSYNYRKYGVSVSSGLINNKYSFSARLSRTLSSGYRDNSWVELNSYYLSAVRFDKNLTTQLNLYGGPLEDGLVYNGLPKWAINNKELRKENYSYWEDADGQYTYTVRRKPTEIENFSQPHFELLNELNISKNITLNSALFLILGEGFFDYDGSWSIFYNDYFRLNENGYDPLYIPNGALIRASVENKQWGWIPRFSLKHDNGELIVGAEFRNHISEHWGSINFASNIPPSLEKTYRYYSYEGSKKIMNFFAHENYQFSEKINVLAELQLAYHHYKIANEKYLNNEFDIDGLFLNPRLGINYKFDTAISSYLSFARITREPRLKNYYDAAESSGGAVPQFNVLPGGEYDFSNPLVKPETMNNLELGFVYNKENINLTLNGFYMLFKDEIVNQGQVDRFGQPITGNMDETIHMGIELSSNIKLNKYIDITLNGAYSKNFISKGSTFINAINGDVLEVNLKDNRISGFPDLTFNGIVSFKYKNFLSRFFAKYVGKFYSDNYDENLSTYRILYPGITDYSDNKVEPYFTANLLMSYEFEADPIFQKIKIFAQVNNVFDKLYAAYAIGKEFFPAAERNIMAGIRIGL